ncbi:MAG: GNAT family N-acetyltransferase [Thermoplasmata archaeon]
MSPLVELRPTIDRAWLEGAAEREPVEHAYALWDLAHYPDRIRMVSAVQDDRTVGYLLVWLGLPNVTIVHWHGLGPGSERLADVLPARPLVVIVPPEARGAVLAARGVGREYPEQMMLRSSERPPELRGTPGEVRRLLGPDGPDLWAWARRQPDPQAAEYPGLDPALDAVWGAFHRGRLVGAARAAVRLPRQWVVAGVYVEPEARRLGFGHALVRSIVTAAEEAGARVGLFVREDRGEARRLYERLGFRAIARRLWLDLGAGLEP